MLMNFGKTMTLPGWVVSAKFVGASANAGVASANAGMSSNAHLIVNFMVLSSAFWAFLKRP
jgi:hypothetical protein